VKKADIPGKPDNKRVIKLLWYTVLGLALLLLILFVLPVPFPEPVFGTILLLICIDFVLIALKYKKFYNWSLVFLSFIIIAVFFKRMRWPVASILTLIGYTGLAIFSVFSARIFLEKYKGNGFLRYIGFASSIIMSVVTMGILFRSMHWPLSNTVLYSGLVMFIPFLFAFVFTLPGSNYISWNSVERAVFFRVIVIPMIFIYGLCVMILVLPDLWKSLTRTQLVPFWMFDFNLLEKPGLL